MDPIALLNLAVFAMMQRQPVTLTHPHDWKRPENWPLPIKRGTPDALGQVTQSYRPIVIMEYCDYALGKS